MIALALAAQLSLTALRVVDGDTFHDARRQTDYRLAGVDTPEIGRAKCPAERAKGQEAAARVAALLAAAQSVVAIPDHDPKGRKRWPVDGFQRRLARIEIDGADLGAILQAEGLAQPYAGGKHPDWCAPR